MGVGGGGGDAPQEEIDGVRVAGAEGAGELVAGEGGYGWGLEGVRVAGLVEGEVGLDVLCELYCGMAASVCGFRANWLVRARRMSCWPVNGLFSWER